MIRLFSRTNKLGDAGRERIRRNVGKAETVEMRRNVCIRNQRRTSSVGGCDGVAVLRAAFER